MAQPSQSLRDRVRPWDCPACDMKRISANKTECPRCHEPRYGSAAAPGSKVMSFGQRMKEAVAQGTTFWTCAVCGQSSPLGIHVCPQCSAPQPGTPEAQAEEASGQTTRVYEGEKALKEGVAQMARQGWRVVSQSSVQPRAGVGRTVALGFVGAALWKPPLKWTVVFERTPAAQ